MNNPIQSANLDWLNTLLSLPKTPSQGQMPQGDMIYHSQYVGVHYEDSEYLIVMRTDKNSAEPWYTLHRWIPGRHGFFFARKAGWSQGERWSWDVKALEEIVAVEKRWKDVEG